MNGAKQRLLEVLMDSVEISVDAALESIKEILGRKDGAKNHKVLSDIRDVAKLPDDIGRLLRRVDKKISDNRS